jgi:hypothetical protein
MELKRKSIDLPDNILAKLELEAVKNRLSIKVYLEKVLTDSVQDKPSPQEVCNAYNKD